MARGKGNGQLQRVRTRGNTRRNLGGKLVCFSKNISTTSNTLISLQWENLKFSLGCLEKHASWLLPVLSTSTDHQNLSSVTCNPAPSGPSFPQPRSASAHHPFTLCFYQSALYRFHKEMKSYKLSLYAWLISLSKMSFILINAIINDRLLCICRAE